MDNQLNHLARLFLAFFRWFCHPHYREDIEGDLWERFAQYKESAGPRKANWLFIKEVLLLFRPGIISINLFKLYNMKPANWIKLVAINALLVLVILSPFLPGPANKLVIGLSVLGQLSGSLPLLLVPVGIIWAIIEIINRKQANNTGINRRPAFVLAIIATAISTATYLLFLLGVFVTDGWPAGLTSLLAGVIVSIITIRGIRKLKNNTGTRLNPAPFYLLTIPLVALVTRIYVMEPVSNKSRDLAIEKTQSLITLIEAYKSRTGQYPDSIEQLAAQSTNKIPTAGIMGILNIRYNKINDQYSLSFSQWLELGSLEEIVLYDKSDLRNNLKGHYAAYDYGFDLCRIKGAFAVHDTRYTNWQYYHVD